MTGRTSKYLFFVLTAVYILAASCNSGVVYTDAVALKGEKWEMNNELVFEVPVKDTVTGNNISFTIRTGTEYPFRNIWLFTSATSPSGKVVTDTVQYMIADEKGNRYGKGFGDIRELNLPYRTSIYFPEKGVYTFRIIQGMRPGILTGVYDFGLRVEKTAK